MSYFQAQFSNAPANMPDARQTQNFINNLQKQEQERKERAKVLSEDQKRLSLLAQGYGLQKGEADSMSRGELSGFVENQAMQIAQKKAQQDQILNLAKFQNQLQQTDINRQMAQSQLKFAEANINAQQNKFLQRKLEELRTKKDANLVRGKISKAEQGLGSQDPEMRRQSANFIEKTGLGSGMSDLSDARLLEQHRAGMAKNDIDPYSRRNPASTDYDKMMMKTLVDFNPVVAQSNKRKIQQSINKLKSSISSGKPITGTAVSFLPDFLRNIVDEDGMELQQDVESVIQMNLRETLGAAFARTEGEMFLARGFNPNLNDPANLRKLEKLLTDIQGRIDEQTSKYEHYYTPQGNYGINTFHGFRPPALQDSNATQKNYNQTTSSGNRVNINIPGSSLKKN